MRRAPAPTHEAGHHDFVKTVAGMRILQQELHWTVADCQDHAAETWLVPLRRGTRVRGRS
jgi:hypothetical protein